MLAALLLTAAVGAGPAPIESLKGTHPRLLLTNEKAEALRSALGSTHHFLWERYQQDLPHMVAVSERRAPLVTWRWVKVVKWVPLAPRAPKAPQETRVLKVIAWPVLLAQLALPVLSAHKASPEIRALEVRRGSVLKVPLAPSDRPECKA